ncbi:MAG: hypothetical protein RLY78_2539 [Pseudomonadota bacterium]|jgi:phosphoglycerate dehydrogenase-like enzyme
MSTATTTATPRSIASQWDAPLHAALVEAVPGLTIVPVGPGPGFDGLAGLRDATGRPVEVLLARPFAPAQRDAPPPAGWPWGLRWIQLISVGLDGYPAWLLATPGVTVSNAHGSSADTIADFVLAHVLRVQARLDARRVRSPEGWRLQPAAALAGARLGLVGFGAIGRAVAQRALALGLQVRAVRRQGLPDLPGVDPAADVAALAAWADHLVLATPGGPATRHLVDARVLRQARPGLHLINIARGSLVDTDALCEALDNGRVGEASLDVTEPEPLPAGHWLYRHPRVWLTPHTSAIGPQVQRALVELTAEGLQAWHNGRSPAHRVDPPWPAAA